MLGVDVVDLHRFARTLEKAPELAHRFFSPGERAYCEGSALYLRHLAATFAAKEAVMKALGLTPAVAWMRRIDVIRQPSGAPLAYVDDKQIPISISHDGSVVVAIALGSIPEQPREREETLASPLARGGPQDG